MKQLQLGKAGPKVSTIDLGCMGNIRHARTGDAIQGIRNMMSAGATYLALQWAVPTHPTSRN